MILVDARRAEIAIAISIFAVSLALSVSAAPAEEPVPRGKSKIELSLRAANDRDALKPVLNEDHDRLLAQCEIEMVPLRTFPGTAEAIRVSPRLGGRPPIVFKNGARETIEAINRRRLEDARAGTFDFEPDLARKAPLRFDEKAVSIEGVFIPRRTDRRFKVYELKLNGSGRVSLVEVRATEDPLLLLVLAYAEGSMEPSRTMIAPYCFKVLTANMTPTGPNPPSTDSTSR